MERKWRNGVNRQCGGDSDSRGGAIFSLRQRRRSGNNGRSKAGTMTAKNGGNRLGGGDSNSGGAGFAWPWRQHNEDGIEVMRR